jgi:hypothetical protein
MAFAAFLSISISFWLAFKAWQYLLSYWYGGLLAV